MKRFSEQLHKKAGTVKLRVAEKRELRERVVSYMEYHPLPATMKQKRVLEPAILTESYRVIRIPFTVIARYTAAALAVMLVVVPFIAERSVPGDALYAVKVRFNEEVRSTLVFNTYEKVEWETERLNRRIAEARLLASEGRLTEEVEAEVAEAVRVHTENAQKGIEEIRAQDADEAELATIALETTLEVQSVSLKDDETELVRASSTDGNSTAFLASVIDESRAKNNAIIASSTVSFDKVMARVELNTTRAHELLQSVSDTATPEDIADIERRIADIERSIASAIALNETDGFSARAQLIDALQRVQRLIVFMTDIEVSTTVDIESIVPVVLTDDEKTIMIRGWETDLTEKISLINEALRTEEEPGVITKANSGLARIEETKQSITENQDFIFVKNAYGDAIAFAEDILLMFETVPTTVVEEPVASSTASTTVDKATSTEDIAPEGDSTATEGQ